MVKSKLCSKYSIVIALFESIWPVFFLGAYCYDNPRKWMGLAIIKHHRFFGLKWRAYSFADWMPVINFCCLNPAKGDSKNMGDPQTMGETALKWSNLDDLGITPILGNLQMWKIQLDRVKAPIAASLFHMFAAQIPRGVCRNPIIDPWCLISLVFFLKLCIETFQNWKPNSWRGYIPTYGGVFHMKVIPCYAKNYPWLAHHVCCLFLPDHGPTRTSSTYHKQQLS